MHHLYSGHGWLGQLGGLTFRSPISNSPFGKNHQEVLLKDLAGTDLFLLTFTGAGRWTEDALGRPAMVAYDWTYKMTLQRVDERGNPL